MARPCPACGSRTTDADGNCAHCGAERAAPKPRAPTFDVTHRDVLASATSATVATAAAFGWEHLATDDLGGAHVRVHLRRQGGRDGAERLDVLEGRLAALRDPAAPAHAGEVVLGVTVVAGLLLAWRRHLAELLGVASGPTVAVPDTTVAIGVLAVGIAGRWWLRRRAEAAHAEATARVVAERADILTEARGIVGRWG